MKIFLTGATGFLGGEVVRRLGASPHSLVCLVRKSSRHAGLAEQGVQLVYGDVTDAASVLAGMQGCDAVIHMAALYSMWEPDPNQYERINVDGTRNVMEAALACGVKKIVYVSSIVAYGRSPDNPVREDSPEGPPTSRYSASKQASDRLVWQMHRERGLPVVVVYPGAIWGANDPKPSGQYIHNLLNRKIPSRMLEPYCGPAVHVRDVAEIVVCALEKEGNLGERYMACKYGLSLGEINQLVHEISGVPLPRLRTPTPLVFVMAHVLTWLANRSKRPPLWGLSVDQYTTSRYTPLGDGTKTERELGITFTPPEQAIREAVKSLL